MFVHLDKKLCILSNAVRITSAHFLEVRIHPHILVMTVTQRCPVSSARSAQKFGGNKNRNMKR